MADKEKIVTFGNRINYYIPSDDIEHNFLFDTCAINEIMKHSDVVEVLKKTKEYNYYISDAQMRELNGIVDRKEMKMTIDENVRKSNENTFEFIKNINCKRVSCVALLLENFWILDGSFRAIDEKSSTYPMFNEIHNNNLHHIKDAVIAEATIYNNCTLVTNDSRLNKKVNKYFTGRSLMYEDFVSKII